MKISVNMTKWFTGFELPAVDDLVQKIGAQLGAVEEVIDVGGRYNGAYIVKVVSCEKHPDADKLSLCLIDDGGAVKDAQRNNEGLVQVVCGAPNVRAEMLAVWLPPGATVPSTVDYDPFTLEARELRGKVSNGMLASPKELALGDSHDGIFEILGDYPAGSDFAEVFSLKNEYIIDIENKMFTHRPDCFGFMGVAREVSGIYNKPFKSPDWYIANPEFAQPEEQQLPFTVTNELPEQVPRFSAIALSDIHVGKSPAWLIEGLSLFGQKSVNNIVDLTNWYMLETGQPLHAYDYDKVKALSGGDPALVVRKPSDGESIKLLNGKEIQPRSEAIMIATDKQLIGIGGVMGGSETEVDDNTKNIIIECASFDMYSIRRTSMTHGLFTDAVTRFTKGQSPLQTLAILNRIVTEIVKPATGDAVGKVAGAVVDDIHVNKDAMQRQSLHAPVTLTAKFVNDRLGLDFSADQIKELLENVEFKVDQNGEDLTFTAPFWRTDIEIAEDIVEEVGRLHGFDKLPLVLPKLDLTPAEKDPSLEVKAAIRDQLSKAGANEILSYSFVHSNLLQKVGQDKDKAFQISNALSPDLQYYRLSLTPSLLEKVHPNNKAGYGEFALFEIGTVQAPNEVDDEGLPKPFGRVAMVLAADSKAARTISGAPYYHAKQYVNHLLGDDEINFVPLSKVDIQGHELFTEMLRPFDTGRSAVIYRGKQLLGVVGEYTASTRRNLKLPNHSAGFELFLSAFTADSRPEYVPLSRFPSVKQDITLRVDSGITYEELFEFVSSELSQQQPKDTTPTLEPIDIYQAEDDAGHKNITLRLHITSFDRTLTDSEVNGLLDSVASAAKNKFNAERI